MDSPQPSQRRFLDQRTLLLIILAFLGLRLPAMYLQPGGQDEEYYAVPGLTILENGVPRLPHVPARNSESVFVHGEECLFSEPPLYFYNQALFYLVLPDVYGSARLATAIAGCCMLICMFVVARQLHVSAKAALTAVGLFSMSRWFFFSAIAARPDMLCAVFGLMATVFLLRWKQERTRKHLVAIGLTIGLGGLSHMYAIAYAIPIGVWILCSAQGLERLWAFTTVTLVAIVTALLWLILILQYPDVFGQQLGNQLFHGQGGSMFQRLVWPWRSLSYHVVMLWEHIGAWQFILALSGTVTIGWIAWRASDHTMQGIIWLALCSFWLISVLVGPHHPVFGYWTFSTSLIFIGVGLWIDQLMNWISSLTNRATPISRIALLGLFFTMIPGSGIRTFVKHVTHLNDINYNAPKFAADIISKLPADAQFAVDTQFVLDFLVADRQTLMAETFPMYFRVNDFEFEYLVVSRHGIDMGIVEKLDVKLLWSQGIRSDPLARYVEVYSSNRVGNLKASQEPSSANPLLFSP